MEKASSKPEAGKLESSYTKPKVLVSAQQLGLSTRGVVLSVGAPDSLGPDGGLASRDLGQRRIAHIYDR